MRSPNLFRAAVCGLALCFLVAAAAGQQPAPPAGAGTSRDNFHGKAGKIKRLSPEELEKEVEADFAREKKAGDAEPDDPAPAKPDAVSPLRLSRDAVSPKAFAKATAAKAAKKKGGKEYQITLKNLTIEKYKNRATLTTPFQIIRSRAHAISEDGDMHIAGLADEVMLACVAEIMNIRDFPAATKLVRNLEKSQDTTMLTGVFRLWCEHPDSHGGGPQIQDDVIPDYVDTNPAHVFEIHPASRIGTVNLLESFKPIPEGFTPKAAKKAFTLYESMHCRIVPDPEQQTTTLFTGKIGFNYVKFKMRVDEDQHLLTFDTRIIRGSALTLDDHELVDDRRMVFVRNSPPEKIARDLKKGDTLVVLGMPRIDLALVSWRARNADVRPQALTWNLPYEMIIVAAYEDQDARATPPSSRIDRIFGRVPFPTQALQSLWTASRN